MAVDVIAPTMGVPKEGSLSMADFPQNEKGWIIACPQGHAPVKYRQEKKGVCSIAFALEDCNVYPLCDQCPVKQGRKRHYLRFYYMTLPIAGCRAREHISEFRDKYRLRAGIEATFSEMDRKTRIKRLRIRGLSAVSYCAGLKAIGVNFFRAAKVKRGFSIPQWCP